MPDLLEIWEKPDAKTIHMIVGWRQWADAGSISSGLPQYLIEKTKARKIGAIQPNDFYLFQIPGTHDLLRPIIKLEDGFRRDLEVKRNEFYYAGEDQQGLVIFLGDEPHLKIEQYAAVFFEAVKELGVGQIAGVAGVYGSVPYAKDRQISCIYSLREMKAKLAEYAVNFSNYEGGSSIGSYLVSRAEHENVPFLVLYGFVPAYNFSQSMRNPQGLRLDNDYRAWYDIMHRINHMFDLSIDLSHLQRQSDELIAAIDAKVAELEQALPQFNVREYLDQLETEFTELSFWPLDDVWERELRDLFEDDDQE